MLRCIVHNPWFALTEVGLILASGLGWILIPDVGIGFILLALLPWFFRLLAGTFPFQRTPFDWLIAIFLVTAWIGYWAAYDKTAAWNKVWIIVLAVLLYYALSAQPKHNLVWISFILFGIGVGTSFYYFLTHDFVAAPRKLEFVNNIGNWIMGIRPQTGWGPIHPNYVAGIVAVTVPFIFYPVWRMKSSMDRFPPWLAFLVIAGLVVAGFALVMATSRGVVLAILAGMGAWFMWWFIDKQWPGLWQKNRTLFPCAIFVYLCAVIVFLYAGPAQSAGAVTGSSSYTDGSRAELFLQSLYLIHDFPITGGGLGSFPGLYSQYLLNIPSYYLPNSHNLFLDVAIEQGVIGGLSFVLLYAVSLWIVSSSVGMGHRTPLFQWVILFSLIVVTIHGMVDDYLYNGAGSVLSLFLVGLSVNERWQDVHARRGPNLRVAGILAAVSIVGLLVYLNPIRSIWYANLGAVQLAKNELAGFPTNKWTESSLLPSLEVVDVLFRSALQYNPINPTANYYLGRILMLRQDFDSACSYLETAHKKAPVHRGIVKSLGYCYIWLGDLENAQSLLAQIPEAGTELNVYVWWWQTQGQPNLSERALIAADRFGNGDSQK